MGVSRRVMRRAVELLDAGVPFALCTVVEARGSVPGKAGAKMIVMRDGASFGTVGGAGLEEKVRDLGRRAIALGRNLREEFVLARERAGALDSLCGGAVEILVEFMAPAPHLLICGGGHVGLEVARLCEQIEYAYSVLDDRAEFASRARFPAASGLFVARPEAFFPAADLGGYSHVVILGYSYKIDTDALLHCVTRFPGYIGLIASRKKRREMFAALEARGMSAAALARVEAPLGLPIGAETPGEIAVSILGSLIRHHKGGQGDARAEDSSSNRGELDENDEPAAIAALR